MLVLSPGQNFSLQLNTTQFTHRFSLIIISRVTTSSMSCSNSTTVSRLDASPSFCNKQETTNRVIYKIFHKEHMSTPQTPPPLSLEGLCSSTDLYTMCIPNRLLLYDSPKSPQDPQISCKGMVEGSF